MRTFNNFKWIFLIVHLPLLLTSCNVGQLPVPEKPNILFLLADDMGYGELGSYGQQVIRTPFLDNMAEQGIRFTDFYAGNAVCSPSRAVLMTGKHAGHVSIRGNQGIYENNVWDRVALSKDEMTIGEILQTAGYQTAFIGKWHMADPNNLSTWAYYRGFDFAVQEQWSGKSGGRIFDESVHWINGMEDSIRYDKEQYDCIDEFRTNFALDYIDNMERDKPFFLFMSYRTPHANEIYIRNMELYNDRGWSETERRHAARITLLDREIGRLLNKLKEKNILENTLILFSSDNGPHHERGHDPFFFKSSGGLRGGKRDLYEGGIRVPLIVNWKDRIQAGSVTKLPCSFCDIMPTLAEVAEIELPEGIDGISVLPEFLGQNQKEHEYLYWEIQLNNKSGSLSDRGFRQAVRLDNWKAVRYGTNSPIELYDLDEDINESINIAGSHPGIIEEIGSLLKTVRTDVEHFPYGGNLPE